LLICIPNRFFDTDKIFQNSPISDVFNIKVILSLNKREAKYAKYISKYPFHLQFDEIEQLLYIYIPLSCDSQFFPPSLKYAFLSLDFHYRLSTSMISCWSWIYIQRVIIFFSYDETTTKLCSSSDNIKVTVFKNDSIEWMQNLCCLTIARETSVTLCKKIGGHLILYYIIYSEISKSS
jgi:hypothetical protein